MNIGAKRTAGFTLCLTGALVAGCAGTGREESLTRSARAPETTVTQRPRLAASAAESYATDADQLDFFDALESRELVSQDDALHAALLILHGSSAETFNQRSAIAKRSGLVEPTWNPQPRDAITVEELAELVRSSVDPGARSPLAALQSRGMIPTEWRPARGVSGSELLGILRRTSEARAAASAPTTTE